MASKQKSTFTAECFTDATKIRIVDPQNSNRRSSNRGSPKQFGTEPLKVIGPHMAAGIKKRNHFSVHWIKSRQIRSFMTVAMHASKS